MLSPKNRNCLKLEIAFSTKNAAHRTLAHLNLHFSGGVPPLSQHTPPATFIRRSPRQRRKIVREKSAPSPFPGEADTTQQNAHGRAADEAHKRMFFSPIRRAQTCRKLSTLKARATSDPTAPRLRLEPRNANGARSPSAAQAAPSSCMVSRRVYFGPKKPALADSFPSSEQGWELRTNDSSHSYRI